MNFITHIAGPDKAAELCDQDVLIAREQDALDLMAEAQATCGAGILVIHQANLHPDFFRLATGLAGAILQKFTNYGVRLVIVGEFHNPGQGSLADFIRECNRGRHICFAADVAEGLHKLTGAEPEEP